MSFKTTIVIAILLLLVGGYAYFYEYKGGQKREEQKEKEKTLFEVKKEDVAQIQLEAPDSQPITLVREGKDHWKLTQPLQTKADQATVDRILGSLEKVQYKEIIEEHPKNLKDYELEKPPMTVRLTLKGKDQRVLSIGAKNPISNEHYIRIQNDPRVYLSEDSVGDPATITLLDLRDKKLTDFSAEKVESVSLKTADVDAQFKKENDAWKLVKPVQSPASEAEVTTMLSSLENLRATRFIDDPSDDLSEYGLKDPAASIELVLEKGLHQKFLFGKASGETYFRIDGNPMIAAVGDSLNETIDQKLEDWREKKVLVFNRFDAHEVRIQLNGKMYAFQKAETDKWNQLSPAKGEVEYDQMQTVLEKIETAEISKYGEEPKLPSSPVAEVFLTMKDWEEKVTKEHLAFGPVADELQPVKNDDYGMIVYASPSLLEDIRKALTEIKAKPPAPPAAEKKP
jgi:hypothetical protein